MADSTLEERVEALETQLAELTGSMYQMIYSGEQLESILDFVEARKLKAGRATASVTSNFYRATTDINYNDYNARPVCFAELCYLLSGNETRKPVGVTVRNNNGKIEFVAYCTNIPTNATSTWFRYIVMERT